jgi:hypothetical protein
MLDRQRSRSPFRVVEVMNVNQVNPDSSPAESDSLFDLAGREDAAISRLEGRVDDWLGLQSAKVAVNGSTLAGSRAELAVRPDTRHLAT